MCYILSTVTVSCLLMDEMMPFPLYKAEGKTDLCGLCAEESVNITFPDSPVCVPHVWPCVSGILKIISAWQLSDELGGHFSDVNEVWIKIKIITKKAKLCTRWLYYGLVCALSKDM